MERKVIVDGMSFIASGRDYLYNSNTRQYLHRYLWEREYGKIPEGYEIHHKDKNPLNNDLNNLELLSSTEHKKLHSDELTDDNREKLRLNILKNALPKAIEWHGSEEGIEWHKKHYEATKHLLHKEVSSDCVQCGQEFTKGSNGQNKFCSNSCKSKYRREQGLDDELRICPMCGTEFKINKYRKTKTCSRTCAAKLRSKDSPNLHE